ncbi:hypothetical protein GX563_07130 [Candidatus Bathyarchaeota archaeon]|nr:hypothetical protein [Candidatus Bathyarchaeota archaeon]
MQKWADYLISAVKTVTGSSTVEALEVHSDFGSMVCETAVVKRDDVIANLRRGVTYSTVFKTAMGKWRKGDDVHLVTINGKDYLRTNNELVPRDQFDEVPEL